MLARWMGRARVGSWRRCGPRGLRGHRRRSSRLRARGAKGPPLAASPSPCRPSPQSASTSISRPNTNRSSPPERFQKSPSPPSCANSSYSPTPSSRTNGNGPQNQLGQNGYSSDNPVRQQESRPRAHSPRRSTFLEVFCDHVLYRIGTSPILHTRAAIARAQAVLWCVGYLLNDRKTRR
jgi:hypothetical protein